MISYVGRSRTPTRARSREGERPSSSSSLRERPSSSDSTFSSSFSSGGSRPNSASSEVAIAEHGDNDRDAAEAAAAAAVVGGAETEVAATTGDSTAVGSSSSSSSEAWVEPLGVKEDKRPSWWVSKLLQKRQLILFTCVLLCLLVDIVFLAYALRDITAFSRLSLEDFFASLAAIIADIVVFVCARKAQQTTTNRCCNQNSKSNTFSSSWCYFSVWLLAMLFRNAMCLLVGLNIANSDTFSAECVKTDCFIPFSSTCFATIHGSVSYSPNAYALISQCNAATAAAAGGSSSSKCITCGHAADGSTTYGGAFYSSLLESSSTSFSAFATSNDCNTYWKDVRGDAIATMRQQGSFSTIALAITLTSLFLSLVATSLLFYTKFVLRGGGGGQAHKYRSTRSVTPTVAAAVHYDLELAEAAASTAVSEALLHQQQHHSMILEDFEEELDVQTNAMRLKTKGSSSSASEDVPLSVAVPVSCTTRR